jgi:putative endonuclease
LREKPARSSTSERRQRYRNGLWSETLAAAMLRLKGYRIVARRFQSGAGEVDLIAVRGQRIAFIEVKRRASREAAEASISDTQRSRIRTACDLWLQRHPRYQTFDIAFDVVFVMPGRWPEHLQDAL